MNKYKLTFVKYKKDKRIVEVAKEYHIFSDIKECLNWLKRDLSISCMPYFDVERVNPKLITVLYNEKFKGNGLFSSADYIRKVVEIRRVNNNGA